MTIFNKYWISVYLSFALQFPLTVVAQTTHISLNQEHGLSNGSVTDIIQDSLGFIWVATKHGLNRYDATSFKIFDSENCPIASDDISDLLLDKRGQIWIGTVEGELAFYNAQNDNIQNIDVDGCILSKGITTLSSEDVNHMWVGTEGGLIQYGLQSNYCEHYTFISSDSTKINPEITNILTIPDGHVFVGTFGHGLWSMDPGNNQFQHIELSDGQIRADYILTLKINPADRSELLIGTHGNGLVQLNLKTLNTIPYPNFPYPNSIIRDLYFDSKNNLWVGTDGDGLFNISPLNKVEQFSFPVNSITNIFQDRQKNIWLGTARDGLIILEEKSQNNLTSNGSLPVLAINIVGESLILGLDGKGLTIKNLFENTWQNIKPNGASYVQFIKENRQGRLWLGTFSNGLLEYDLDEGVRNQFQHLLNNPQSLNFNDVRDVIEMPNGNLWIASWGGGLNFYNKRTGEFSSFTKEKNALFDNNIVDLEKTEQGLWLSTFGGGLFFMDFKNHKINPVVLKKGNSPDQIEEVKNLLCLNLDNNGELWIGTWKNGLFKLQTQTEETYWYDHEIIRKQTITAILDDNNGNTWLSTKEGILMLNNQDTGFQFFPEFAGEYYINSKFKDKSGILYFGGKSGVKSIIPEQTQKIKRSIPPVIVTEARIFNQNRKAVGQGILHKNIASTKQLNLKYSQNTITISFSTLDFPDAKNWEYAIRLVGLEQHWREIGGQNNTTFTNLRAGEYEFRVKSRYQGDDWKEPYSSLKIIVDKPFWATGWAFLGYFLMVLLALLLFRKYTIAWENMKHKLQMETMLHHKDNELIESKQRLFNNISHEIRTPLTLIFAAINQLKNTGVEDPRQINPIKKLQKNAKHLLNLVDELLTYRKIEIGEVNLNKKQVDLVAFTHEVFLAFDGIAEKKNIRMEFIPHDDRIAVEIDTMQIEKVIYNLLTNAFKFTNTGGQVKMELKNDDDSAYIFVSDTGVGIPKQKQHKIFQRFYQQEFSENPKSSGFGIGLSIVKDIVEMHNGKVWVESEVNKGSTFIVKLPLLIIDSKGMDSFAITTPSEIPIQPTSVPNFMEESTLLIVEDNNEIRAFLRKILNSQYHVLEASNGEEGLKMARSYLPDLIISDILMPIKNGLELVKEIKSDLRSCHIPIILLTSKVGWVFKKEGFDVGADDYITKPFNEEILKARIRNLIKSRQEIWKSISVAAKTRPKELAISDLDQQFLEQFISHIEENILDANLSPDLIAQKMGMSHSVIYKKLKHLTGVSIVEFIRDFRLKRAAELLSKGQDSIKEIGYSCGFSDRRYFSKVFKQKYRLSPSQFRKMRNEPY